MRHPSRRHRGRRSHVHGHLSPHPSPPPPTPTSSPGNSASDGTQSAVDDDSSNGSTPCLPDCPKPPPRNGRTPPPPQPSPRRDVCTKWCTGSSVPPVSCEGIGGGRTLVTTTSRRLAGRAVCSCSEGSSFNVSSSQSNMRAPLMFAVSRRHTSRSMSSYSGRCSHRGDGGGLGRDAHGVRSE